ncbi:MAG: hypothetical protein FD149_2201 [Rhodospirillaceae bacterium]|nr:MAG: hypothetical protein FD149_2201 [Rhodospirillaceae bacterium]
MSTPEDAIAAGPSSNIEQPGTLFVTRLYRNAGDPADTFPERVYLLHTTVKYRVGQLGTVERNRPFTSRGF